MQLCEILGQLLLRINFGSCSLKENREGEGRAVSLAISGFRFFQGSYLLNHETMFFLHKFSHSAAFKYG